MIHTLIRIIIYLPMALALSVSQPYRVEGEMGRVPLHCSFSSLVKPQEMQVGVFRGLHGHQKVCSAFIHLSKPHFETAGAINCKGNVSSGRVDIIISGLRPEDTDLYRCELEILFPPPYLKRVGNGTLVHIREKLHCPTASPQKMSLGSEQEHGSDLLIFALLLITLCSLFLQVSQMIMWRRRHVGSPPPMLSQAENYVKF